MEQPGVLARPITSRSCGSNPTPATSFSMKRVYLIHGWEGNPNSGWKGWIRKELEKKDFKVFAPYMPNAKYPKVSEWISYIDNIVKRPDKDTYFIGHSLGCIGIARYLEKLPTKNKIGGCIFVAGFSGNINETDIAEFYTLPFNIEKVKQHTKNFVAILSDNDDLVPLKIGKDFGKKLGADIIIEHNKGHISGSEVAQLPSALESLLKMSK